MSLLGMAEGLMKENYILCKDAFHTVAEALPLDFQL